MNTPDDSAEEVFNDALEFADLRERSAFLDRDCGDNATLRQQVEDLLLAHEQGVDFMKGQTAPVSSGTTASSEKPGDKIGRYTLLQQIGQGGWGVVYLAEQKEPIRRQVALKVIKLGMDTKTVIARFEAERQALALMDHPNIARVFDAGATDTGRPYFVMELVKGLKITRYCDENNLSTGERLKLFMLVCEAIQHAHQKGIIHRDIKPSNILVATIDGRPMPKVIDFGIAKATRERLTDKTLFTMFSQFIGTPDYMSPEQAEGNLDIDTRSDIYSLGVLLYEILTGTTPFNAEKLLKAGLEKVRQTIREEEPARPSTRLSTMDRDDQTRVAKHQQITPAKLVHALKGDLDWIVLKSLEKDRARRYTTAGSLGQDIECHLNHLPVAAGPPSNWYRAKKFVRRHPVGLAFAGIILMLLIGLQVGFSITRSLKIERDVARQMAAIQDAELSAKTGKWQETLQHLNEAEAAGYADTINLGLMRAEAYTALNQPDRSGAELRRLVRRTDLGKRYGAVHLRMGDYELFDKATVNEGIQDVREAMAAGLEPADLFIAEGLLTNSVLDALNLFQQALQADPYSHAAHVHSLGMQFVLGRHTDLASHIRVFSILYPDDPSGRYMEASEYALAGKVPEAIAALEPLHRSMSDESWSRLVHGYKDTAEAARCFDVDTVVKTGTVDANKLSKLMSESGNLITASLMDLDGLRLREPHLPCLEHGLLDGVTAVQALAATFYSDVTPAVGQLKDSLQLCPESVLPFRAATLLETRQPRSGHASLPLRAIQAELFQMAADMPSFVPTVPRGARYLATKMELQLVQSHSTNAAQLRANCLRNLRAAAASEPSLTECRAYFPIAIELSDYDSAKQLLNWWEKAAPDDTDLAQRRVELELMAGNFGAALHLIDSQLSRFPNDPWARDSRRRVIALLQDLLNSSMTTQSKPMPSGEFNP
jgi:serine/threonine protein kinase/tetratricopeptide (TPR) repeat protein